MAVMLAGAIMAVAVCSMHYIGMSALQVHLNASSNQVHGTGALTFLVPILLFVLLVVVALGYAMLNSPSERDTASLEDLETRITTAAAQPQAQARTFR